MTILKGKKKKNGEKTEALSMLWENEGNLGLFQQSIQSFFVTISIFQKEDFSITILGLVCIGSKASKVYEVKIKYRG